MILRLGLQRFLRLSESEFGLQGAFQLKFLSRTSHSNGMQYYQKRVLDSVHLRDLNLDNEHFSKRKSDDLHLNNYGDTQLSSTGTRCVRSFVSWLHQHLSGQCEVDLLQSHNMVGSWNGMHAFPHTMQFREGLFVKMLVTRQQT